ncbi:MAG: M14 family metallocarboxypeptidase, partial [Verrucomicrobia bacterium]|nr:M14 family metallocarboxypeptidase [Verrucomicrobiota bacterium]
MSFASNNGHRAHDCTLLAKRWAALAKRIGMNWKKFAMAGDYPVHAAESSGARNDNQSTIYLSAGVHGDEAAAPWGLLEWAEENVALIRANRFLIFPCLNPHGIVNNTRVDQRGVDINRTFNDSREPLIAAWRKVLGSRGVSLAICLHEDYDAQGCYSYELRRKPGTLAPKVLRDCAKIIPPDTRGKIDGRNMKNGHFLRRGDFDLPDLPGLPEAIVLHQLGSEVTLTFESPSEFSLLDRIAVQKEFIRSAL